MQKGLIPSKDEVKNIRETKDCLDKFRAKVTSAKLLENSDLDAIDADVARRKCVDKLIAMVPDVGTKRCCKIFLVWVWMPNT